MKHHEAEPHWSHRFMPQVIELMQSIRDHTKPSEFSDLWTAQTYVLPTGRSQQIVNRNRQRRRGVLWTDASNTTAVWIGSAPYNGTDAPTAGDGYVPIAPGSQPYEFFHCGDIYAWSSSNGAVCKVEEYGAS